ncbi:MAG: aspartate ammonia-lyase [Megasphaera sp.]|uniref:aspartate ammonia-lyase n=1 Tax=Megasphaera sp. TaxID=2023260 RepID=UPI003F0F4155
MCKENEKDTRRERDLLGERELPADALYGINTARAVDNFPLDHKKTSVSLIYAIVTVKKAAALTYAKLGVREDGIYEAIAAACDDILAGQHDDAFVTEALQGGAGTSTNMNVNEVLANLALLKLGKRPGQYDVIHPLDDVNRGQSTNDVYPTALRIAAIFKLRELSKACADLQEAFQHQEQACEKIYKLGRTELMDAVPMTLGEEFGAYAQALSRDRWRIYKVEERLRMVNLGGTAIGTSDTASRQYRFEVIEKLRQLTGIGLAAAEYPVDLTQNNDVFVEVSGLLKALAVNLMKIANDLRLMNSGPYGGIGEIRLPARQQGSSIMPGKVNPVIPEMVMQCAMKAMANDSAIGMAAAHGEFELNAFEPLIADCLLESINLLTKAVSIFRTSCVEGLEVRQDQCLKHLQESASFGAAYISTLGYDTVSRVIKEHKPHEAWQILEEMCREKK